MTNRIPLSCQSLKSSLSLSLSLSFFLFLSLSFSLLTSVSLEEKEDLVRGSEIRPSQLSARRNWCGWEEVL